LSSGFTDKVKIMKKMMALISALAVLMIAFSGCVGNGNSAVNGTEPGTPGANAISDVNVSEISKLKTVPANFSYNAALPLTIDEIKRDYKAENVSGILEGYEGCYKDSNKTDYYIDVIKLGDQEATNNFITAYKSSFSPLKNVSRFTDESFNGHSAVKITDYVTSEGKDIPRYSYIWNNKNYVIVVFGNTADDSLVKRLAEATGY
jgi:outer membrane lipoprotein-sorting protein